MDGSCQLSHAMRDWLILGGTVGVDLVIVLHSGACLSPLSAYHDGGAAVCEGISCQACADEANASSQCPAGHLYANTP